MKSISTVIRHIVALAMVVVSGFILYKGYLKYENPCSLPLTYKIETFDTEFGISKEKYLRAVETAVTSWETKTGKDLFQYEPIAGKLKLNLIFDQRQQATNKLGTLDSTITSVGDSYDTAKSRYNALISKYNNDLQIYEADRKTYEAKRDAYQAEVSYWNKKGGAPEDVYTRLAQEKKELASEQKALDLRRQNLNTQVNQTNALADKLNVLAKNININISQYNAVGKSVNSEFDQGLYERDENGERINVYQFDDIPALVHVLTHEFGHALDLEHSQNAKSIMYYLHQDTPQVITPEDVFSLKTICKIK